MPKINHEINLNPKEREKFKYPTPIFSQKLGNCQGDFVTVLRITKH